MIDDVVSEKVIGACIEVHRWLGPGLLESIYEDCLCYELHERGMEFARQVSLPLQYKGFDLGSSYRLDLVVENRVIIELKSVDAILPVHLAQVSTYLRLTQLEVGLLVNFNVPLLKYGVRRFTKSTDKQLLSVLPPPSSQ